MQYKDWAIVFPAQTPKDYTSINSIKIGTTGMKEKES